MAKLSDVIESIDRSNFERVKIMADVKEQPHCEECEKCKYYWENQDDEYINCDGEETICHEFIGIKETKLNG